MIAGVVILVVAAVVALVKLRSRTGAGSGDGMAVALLAVIARHGRADTRGWAAAMLAECRAIDEPDRRRRFARGGLVGLLRSPAGRQPGVIAVQATAVVGIAAAMTLALYGLIHYPGLRDGSVWLVYLALFIFGLLGYAAVAYLLARLGNSAACLVGVVAALPALAGGWFAATSNSPASVAVASAIALLPALAACYQLRRETGTSAGAMVAATCCAIVAGLLAFVGLIATSYAQPAEPTPAMLHEFAASAAPDYRTWVIGDALGGACFLLVYIPLIGTTLGVIISALARPKAR